jgi:hypothetical protein
VSVEGRQIDQNKLTTAQLSISILTDELRLNRVGITFGGKLLGKQPISQSGSVS